MGDDRECLNTYVTEMTEETQDDHIDYIGESAEEFVAKARAKQTSIPTTSSTTTLLYHQREWIDFESGPLDKSCFKVSKKMIRLLRHDPSVLREEDGAVEFRILAQFKIHVFWIDSGWQRRQERETCGVLYGRESNVHRSLSRQGLRHSPELQCTTTLGKYFKILYIGIIRGLLRVKDCTSIKHDYNTLLAMCIEKVVVVMSGEELYRHRKELF